MKCEQCEQELTGRQASYCSDRCRMAAKRKVEQNEAEREQYQLTDEQLDNLPVGVTRPGSEAVAWARTECYYKLMYQLVTWPLTKLEEAGVWIPAWRHTVG